MESYLSIRCNYCGAVAEPDEKLLDWEAVHNPYWWPRHTKCCVDCEFVASMKLEELYEQWFAEFGDAADVPDEPEGRGLEEDT